MGAVFTIALRRYLGPGTAGIYDLAYTPYKFLDNFRNFGTGPALVYERTLDRAAANTAWTINMLSAVAVTGVAQLLAHPIAVYYGHPGIEGILRALSIAYVFASISSVHWFLLLRDRNFRARSIPPIAQVAAAGCVAVLFATWSSGAGVLVVREITSAVIGAVLLWLIYPFRPRIQLVPQQAWILFRYGSWVGGGITLLFLSQNVDVFIAGRVIHRASDIGFYTTSWSLAFITAGVFATLATSMVFPTLSRLQDDRLLLTETLLRAIRLLSILILPASALLASLAPVLIVPVLGNRFASYESSALVLSLLAIYAGNRTVLWIFFEGYKSIGRPWLVPAYNAVKLAVMVPAMIIGVRHGILGLAVTYIPVQLIEIPAALALARRFPERVSTESVACDADRHRHWPIDGDSRPGCRACLPGDRACRHHVHAADLPDPRVGDVSGRVGAGEPACGSRRAIVFDERIVTVGEWRQGAPSRDYVRGGENAVPGDLGDGVSPAVGWRHAGRKR